jgi:hypothetical protein
LNNTIVGRSEIAVAVPVACTHCGNTVSVADEKFDALRGKAAKCNRCAKPFVVERAVAGNAPAKQAAAVSFPLRDGSYVVFWDGTTSPPRCAVCNQPTSSAPAKTKYAKPKRTSIVESLVFLIGGFIGLAIYRIIFGEFHQISVGRSLDSSVTVFVHLCPRHKRLPLYIQCIPIVILAAASAGFLWVYLSFSATSRELGYGEFGLLAILGLLLLVPCLLFACNPQLVGSWHLSPVLYRDRLVWLEVAGYAFLESLDVFPVKKQIQPPQTGTRPRKSDGHQIG